MWKRLLILLAAIFAVELVWLALDSTPSYFFGDSESYLATAVIKYIPAGRSFLYGLLIRRVALHSHSLEALIYLQCLVTGIAAWLIGVILLRIFRAPFAVAACFAILCAFEPLQLMMERFVMTESVSNFLFALQFFLLLAYVRRGRLWVLLIAQVVGVVLIGIRISFLPEVLVNSVLAPLLSPEAVAFYGSARKRFRERGVALRTVSLKTAALHLILCVLVNQAVLSAYKHWYGALMKREPALLYENGAFLLTDFAPILQARDFPDRARGQAILSRVGPDLKIPDNRLAQHFAPDGLWHSVQTEYPNEKTANEVAARTATHAILRQPLATVELALGTYASFFDRDKMKSGLLLDEGSSGDFNPNTVNWLKDRFGVRDVKTYVLTWTKRWHQAAIPWYWIILLALSASPALLFVGPRHTFALRLMAVVTALIFLEGVTLTADRATVRYLTSAAWLVLLMFGIATEAVATAARQR